MNPYFLPNEIEQEVLQHIQKYCRNEFTLIRMTETMLNKSIIDANESLRVILRENQIADYKQINQGTRNKVTVDSYVLSNKEVYKKRTSLYRPETKNGDPRIWVYDLKNMVIPGVLLYFTVYKDNIVVIPLMNHANQDETFKSFFGEYNSDIKLIDELRGKLSVLKNIGWIESTSPFKSNPKDVGETLEKYLGIKPNSLVSADYNGEIELKCKREKGSNPDTLFSMVPNWNASVIKSATEMMLTYGYPSKKYPGYQDLYVTVNNRPNNQGLFMMVNDDSQVISQFNITDGELCLWEYTEVKKRLLEKHPKTCWIVAEEQVINGRINYFYKSVQFTQRPIFSQFTTLIGKGIVTYDWRGRVKFDRTGYNDKGHCFRVSPKYRPLIFGETLDLKI